MIRGRYAQPAEPSMKDAISAIAAPAWGALLVSAALGVALAGLVWKVIPPAATLISTALVFGSGASVFLAVRKPRADTAETLGVELRREDAPDLFGVVDEVRAAVHAPEVGHIVLTNADDIAVRELRVVGSRRAVEHSLHLGLPLLKSHSPEEFRSVLAHELGHFAQRNARSSCAACRIRRTATRTVEPTPSAAAAYLSGRMAMYERSLEELRKQAEISDWLHQRRVVEPTVKNTRPLESEEETELAAAVAQMSQPEAIPLLQSVLEENPDHVGANYRLGQILLKMGDSSGIQYLNRAVAGDPASIFPTVQKIYRYLRDRGRFEEASRCYHRASELYERLQAAEKTCSTVSPDDPFVPHGLSEAVVGRIRAQLAECAAAGTAYLVRRPVDCLPTRPYYLLAVAPKRSAFTRRDNEAGLIERLASELALPRETSLVLLTSENTALREALARIEGSEVFPAAGTARPAVEIRRIAA